VIKEVGGIPIRPKHRATCHCGLVELELDLPNGIEGPRRCDCSICRRKGAIVASVPLSGIRIVKGSEHLKLYQFNTGTAKHYFCGNSGSTLTTSVGPTPSSTASTLAAWRVSTRSLLRACPSTTASTILQIVEIYMRVRPGEPFATLSISPGSRFRHPVGLAGNRPPFGPRSVPMGPPR
jgi:hypothetical protein